MVQEAIAQVRTKAPTIYDVAALAGVSHQTVSRYLKDKNALKPGDMITVVGFPARDGTNYMRISKVMFADGSELVGQGLSAPANEQD